jgi:hypothetical protein
VFGAAALVCAAALLVVSPGASASSAWHDAFRLPPNSCFIPLIDTRESQLVDNASKLNTYFRGLGVTPLGSDLRQFQTGVGSVWNETPADALEKVVEANEANCKDFVLYVAGHGPNDPKTTTEGQVQLGTIGAQKGEEGNTSLTASDLRHLIAGHPVVSFKLIVESCYSGIFLDSSNPNWVSAQTNAVKAGKPSAPSLSNPPANLLEVTVSATRDEACRNSGKFVASLIEGMKKAEAQVASAQAPDEAALLIHTGFANSGWVNQGVLSNGTRPPEQYTGGNKTATRPTTPATPATPTAPNVIIAGNELGWSQTNPNICNGGTIRLTITIDGIAAATPVAVKLSGPGLPSSLTLTANSGVQVGKDFAVPALKGSVTWTSDIVSIGGETPPSSGAHAAAFAQCP